MFFGRQNLQNEEKICSGIKWNGKLKGAVLYRRQNHNSQRFILILQQQHLQ